jgi:hypothetical protein
MSQDQGMNVFSPPGPDPETITNYIRETFPGTDILEMDGAWFLSLDPEKHWPAFATIVTTDDFDPASNLSRPGVFRLNIGVDRATFERLVGQEQDPDYSALDTVLPHPDYSRQHWICILNPSTSTFEEIVAPLLALAHDRLPVARARHQRQS